MSQPVTVRSIEGAKFTHEISTGPHRLIADEPDAVGGDDEGPGPYEFLLGGLGACTAMTLRMYADRKGWPLGAVEVTLRHGRVHADDCADCESGEGLIDEITGTVRIEGDLTTDQRARLMEIAHKCPVHKTLTTETKIRLSAG